MCRTTVADGRKTKPEFDGGETCQVIRHSSHTEEELKVPFTPNTKMWRVYFPAPSKKKKNLQHARDIARTQDKHRFVSAWTGT